MGAVPSNLIQLPPQAQSARDKIWFASDHKCHWCGIETRLTNGNEPDKATRDHVIPRYKGGDGSRENIVLACNLCNNRRCHEDQMGLAEGSLLGKYKGQGRTMRSKKYVVLTGDEKRAIINGPAPAFRVPGPPIRMPVEDVLRAQRDQAQKEIERLRKEMKHYEAAIQAQQLELRTMTVGKLIRKRLIAWLLRHDA